MCEKTVLTAHFVQIKLQHAMEELEAAKKQLAEAKEEVKYWKTQLKDAVS